MPTRVPRADDVCPCRVPDAGPSFAACCGPLVVDGAPADSPEAVMRSRYTAFAVCDVDHLWRTWHPSTRPAEVGDLDGVTWTGLEVLGADEPRDGAGTVDFEARFITGAGERGAVREHSRFAVRAGRWFYVDGDELP